MRLAAFALVTAALAAGCGGVDKAGVKTSEQPVELVLADHDGSPDNSRAWAEAVSRRSGGTLRIRVEAGWGPAADYEKALLGDVRGGKVALAMVNARALDEVGVTSFQPLVAPMLIDSAELERRVLGGDVSRHALAGLDKLGLVGLAVLPTELRRPLGITRVMGSPRAYRRAMVYTREGKVARDALTALGAAPVHKGADVWAESVDAAEVSLGPVEGQGEAARYYSGITANVVLWPQPAAVVMRRDAFDRLSPAQQSALRQAAGDVLDQASRRASDADTSALKNLCRIGAKFVDASPGQIQSDAHRVGAGLRGDRARPRQRRGARADPSAEGKRRSRIADVLQPAHDPAPAAMPSWTAPTRPASAARRPRRPRCATTSTNSPARTGASSHCACPRGRLRYSQRNSFYSTVTTGTYSTDGDAIQISIDQDRRDTFTLRWTLYRGKLSFKRDGRSGLTPLLIKPYRRVD